MLSEQPFENRFLIVDNHPFGRDTLRRTLLSMGAEHVDIAVSAGRAIAMCKNADYDMVLADYDLGEGKNGQQLLEELRSQKLLGNVSAFIILTSETNRDVVLSTLEFQPDDYLAKPYVQKLLLRRVQRLLRYKSSLHEVFQSIDSENYPLAIQDCENYLASSNQFRSNGLRMLAEFYQQIKLYDKAQEIYDSELISQDSDWARLGLAKVYMQQGRLHEAEALFLELINLNYMYIEAYENLSLIYMQLEQYKQAEDIMAKAVVVSPLSIRRQKWYAGICEKNNHHDAAISAWRNIIKLSKNSKNEAAENHLGLIRGLSDFCDYHDSYADDGVTSEAFKNIEIMRSRFHLYGDSELQALLIEGRLNFGKGNVSRGEECMQLADTIYQENPSAFSADTQLELAKSLSETGDARQAEKILTKLVASSTDAEVLARADKVLDEPVSKDGKQKIIELNREGIKAFKAKNYTKAVGSFREAQRYFPKNIELNLNLIQGLVKSIKHSDNDVKNELWLTEAEQCLTQIRNIPASHKKHNNFTRLKGEVSTIQDEVSV